MNNLGMGYDGDKCVAASNESCDSTVSQFYNGQCVRNDCPAEKSPMHGDSVLVSKRADAHTTLQETPMSY